MVLLIITMIIIHLFSKKKKMIVFNYSSFGHSFMRYSNV